jgi:hypothetical protein
MAPSCSPAAAMAQVRRLHGSVLVACLGACSRAAAGGPLVAGAHLAAPLPRRAVYVWDLRTQRCLQRYQDEGCLNGTSMACSPDGSLFATGASWHRVPHVQPAGISSQDYHNDCLSCLQVTMTLASMRVCDCCCTCAGSSSGVVNIYSRAQQQKHTAFGGEEDWVVPEAPIAGA